MFKTYVILFIIVRVIFVHLMNNIGTHILLNFLYPSQAIFIIYLFIY